MIHACGTMRQGLNICNSEITEMSETILQYSINTEMCIVI
jgi:hypothetical protein